MKKTILILLLMIFVGSFLYSDSVKFVLLNQKNKMVSQINSVDFNRYQSGELLSRDYYYNNEYSANHTLAIKRGETFKIKIVNINPFYFKLKTEKKESENENFKNLKEYFDSLKDLPDLISKPESYQIRTSRGVVIQKARKEFKESGKIEAHLKFLHLSNIAFAFYKNKLLEIREKTLNPDFKYSDVGSQIDEWVIGINKDFEKEVNDYKIISIQSYKIADNLDNIFKVIKKIDEFEKEALLILNNNQKGPEAKELSQKIINILLLIQNQITYIEKTANIYKEFYAYIKSININKDEDVLSLKYDPGKDVELTIQVLPINDSEESLIKGKGYCLDPIKIKIVPFSLFNYHFALSTIISSIDKNEDAKSSVVIPIPTLFVSLDAFNNENIQPCGQLGATGDSETIHFIAGLGFIFQGKLFLGGGYHLRWDTPDPLKKGFYMTIGYVIKKEKK